MPKLKKDNGAEISPCIMAKVRYALGITNSKPINDKKCSVQYWNDVVEIIGLDNNKSRKEKKSAKGLYSHLVTKVR